ncbi:hypothetical protein CI238_09238 [Colletotrichum incanum]|uniref:Uncharacterized protein n=1 Tax=Colletotrichum incanum TaxID=1573173 RepID=A0A162PA17_COLIC|nr:hypothetical protein CI238_09238 [Colletotrichum incanum]
MTSRSTVFNPWFLSQPYRQHQKIAIFTNKTSEQVDKPETIMPHAPPAGIRCVQERLPNRSGSGPSIRRRRTCQKRKAYQMNPESVEAIAELESYTRPKNLEYFKDVIDSAAQAIEAMDVMKSCFDSTVF